MKTIRFNHQPLVRSIACLLAMLIAPVLFGDSKPTTHQQSGRTPSTPHAAPATHSAPTRSAPTPSRSAPATSPRASSPASRPASPQVHSAPGASTPHATTGRPASSPTTHSGPGATTSHGNPGAGTASRPGATGGSTGKTFGNGGGHTPGSTGITGNRGTGNSGGRTFGNNSRSSQPFHAPAGSTMSRRSDGGASYSHNGMNYNTDRNGHLSSMSRPGMQAHFASNGSVRSAHFDRPGGARMSVQHGYYGERHVETIRADHSRVVSYGGGRGFVERPMGRRGYVSRTYVYGGRTYVHVYHSYMFRGIAYYGYVPPVYYAPVFYGWAYNPWPRPIVFGWGWRGNPWFGFYGGFFAPAPYYPTASLWLTDYLLAEDLRMAYDARQAALAAQTAQYDAPPPVPADPNGTVMLTPAVKQAIAEEVRQQLDAERAAASQQNGAPPPQVSPTSDQAPAALDPKQRIFVVSSSFAVTVGGQDCGLTPGDIIVRTSDQVSQSNTVGVSVLSSKPGDCPMNAQADVEVATLQEMHNQFQDHVDTGLKQLATNQGQGGLPAAPPPQPRPSPDGVAPPDSAANVEAALQQQQQDANQALAEVQQAAGSN